MKSYDEAEMRAFALGREIRNRVGRALSAAYPKVRWLVDVDTEGGILTISVPDISREWGMVLHLSRPVEELERMGVRQGGELLERFYLSREREGQIAFDHIRRNIKGEAIGAAKGEL